jgi:hypothetical protein
MICWNHGQETDFPETVVVVFLNTSKKIPGNYTTTATFKISFMHHHSRITTYIVRDTDSFTSAAVTIKTGAGTDSCIKLRHPLSASI